MIYTHKLESSQNIPFMIIKEVVGLFLRLHVPEQVPVVRPFIVSVINL